MTDEFIWKGVGATQTANQSITNTTAQPNANKRPYSSSNSSVFSASSGFPFPLITVWLQVRVLPGPPMKPSVS
ncbi:hypothetical protein ACVWZZ_006103 [Bradyrhizobium sp. LM6.10]